MSESATAEGPNGRERLLLATERALRAGREIRVALELHCRGDDPATAATLVRAIESRIEALPRLQDGFAIASTLFLRARAEQRAANTRAVLLEYRFRVLEA